MTPAHLQHLISHIHSFPPLPAVVNKVLSITHDPESSIEDLMNVVSLDPAMASSILKIANSVFYGISGGVSTLTHALSVLGFSEVQNIVLSKAIFNSFKKFESTPEMKLFWKHSFNCGIASKYLISKAGMKHDANELFVAGLIHDVGKLLFYIVYADQYDDLSLDFKKRLNQSVSSEITKFEISHDLVGKALLNSWIFPEVLVDAVGFHHNPLKYKGNSPFPMVVFLADFLSHGLDSGEYNNPDISRIYFNQSVCRKAEEIGFNWSSKNCLVYADEYQEVLERESDLFDMLISG